MVRLLLLDTSNFVVRVRSYHLATWSCSKSNTDKRTKLPVQLRTDSGEKPDQPVVRADLQTSVAVKGTDAAVIATIKRVPNKVVDPNTLIHLYRISDTIGCVVSDVTANSLCLVRQACFEATYFKNEHRQEMPVQFLCRRLSVISQMRILNVDMSCFDCCLIFIQWDKNKGPLVYKSDRARYYCSHRVTSAGPKQSEAMKYLETKLKKKKRYNHDELIQLTISCLSSIHSGDLKPNEFQIGIVSASEPNFRELTEDEVARFLSLAK